MKLNSQVTTKGVHILSVCDATSDKAQMLQGWIEDVRIRRQKLIELKLASEKALRELWLEYNAYIQELHRLFLKKQFVVENITTTEGRNVFARLLSGDNTYSGNVSHTALGSSNTAPAITDVQLGTEVYRKALSSGTYSSNISYLETFYTATETSGTYEEYGNFIAGTGTVNSGQIFNRFTQTIAKSVTETLNVQSQVTWADA